jgi:hypothetical protein
MVILNISCLKQSESITPIAKAQTLAELQRESMMNTALIAAGNTELSKSAQTSLETNTGDPSIFYLNLKYNIVNMDVYDTANIPNSFEQIGNSFLKAFAKIFLKLTGDRTVDIGNIDLLLPDLNLDFNIVKSLKVKRIYIEYNKEFNQSVGNKASFSFINSLDISKVSGFNPLLFSYRKSKNNCDMKCLDFTIVDGNIFNLIKNSKTIPVKPTLTISAIPSVTELKIDGQIEMQIGLKLPF